MEPLESRRHLSAVPGAVTTHEAHEVHLAHVAHLAHMQHVKHVALAAAQLEAQVAADVAASFEASMLLTSGADFLGTGLAMAPDTSNVADLLETPSSPIPDGSSIFSARVGADPVSGGSTQG
jgi:hypothetical protein